MHIELPGEMDFSQLRLEVYGVELGDTPTPNSDNNNNHKTLNSQKKSNKSGIQFYEKIFIFNLILVKVIRKGGVCVQCTPVARVIWSKETRSAHNIKLEKVFGKRVSW